MARLPGRWHAWSAFVALLLAACAPEIRASNTAPPAEPTPRPYAAPLCLTYEKVGAVLLCNTVPTTKARIEEAQARQQRHAERLAVIRAGSPEPGYEGRPDVSGGIVISHTSPLSDDEMEAVLSAAGVPSGWWEDFRAIAWCESSWRRDAVGDGGMSLGIWQLWRGWFPRADLDITHWADPVTNARAALYVREVRGRYGGPGGWTCADKLGIP
ncbi:MAG: hypothetical protein Kow0010_06120 [Dehalococcoidia bacterium]